jgi:isopentenyl-diphosphate delta-isomerase
MRTAMTALIDVLDDDGRPIGAIQRGAALQEGVNFRTVHVFVFNSEGDLLLQRLSATRERNPLQWGSSVAAYPAAGEPNKEAGRRRMWEELGLRTALIEFGTTVMEDGRSRKFVTLFTTVGDRVEIREADHVAELRFVPIAILDEWSASDPSAFTETFLHVYSLYRGSAQE